MSVTTALQIINHELDEYLAEQEGEFDTDTRFAVTWFEQNGMKAGNFGDADNLARARGLSVDSVKHAGIVESAAGKVRLLAREELEKFWSPTEDTHLTIWECTQYLIRALQEEGEFSAAVLLKQMSPDAAGAARDLAYRLFDICDKQGRAREGWCLQLTHCCLVRHNGTSRKDFRLEAGARTTQYDLGERGHGKIDKAVCIRRDGTPAVRVDLLCRKKGLSQISKAIGGLMLLNVLVAFT